MVVASDQATTALGYLRVRPALVRVAGTISSKAAMSSSFMVAPKIEL